MSAPWNPDTDTLMRAEAAEGRYLAPVAEVTVGGVAVPLTACQLVLDGRVNPRVTLRASTPARLAADPRRGTETVVRAGYRRPDGSTDLQTVARLMLTDLDGQEAPGATRTDVWAAGLEHPAMDDPAPSLLDGSTSYTWREVVRIMLQEGYACGLWANPLWAKALSSEVPAQACPNGYVVGGPTVRGQNPDCWRVVTDVAAMFGLEAFYDGLRWVVRTPPALTSPTITTTYGDGLTERVGHRLTRGGDFYTAVSVEYRWTRPDGGEATSSSRRTAEDEGSPFTPYQSGVRELTILRDRPGDGNAGPILRRRLAAGRTVRVTTRSRYWLTPGDTVRVSSPWLAATNLQVVAVDHDLLSGWSVLDLATPAELTA